MDSGLYWVMALSFGVILLIILINDIRIKTKSDRNEKAFRMMASWMIFFCLQDCVWGLCAARVIECDSFFFAISSVFHMAAVITTFFWLNYALSNSSRLARRICLGLDILFILFEAALVGTNIKEPVLFSISDGTYYTEYMRPVTFFIQYVSFLITGLIALVLVLKKSKGPEGAKQRERHLTIFFASLFPILLGFSQLKYPYAPYYSMGYFFASFVIHIFVVAKDRTAAEKASLFKSISQSYYSLHIIDIEKDKIERYIESDIIKGIIGGEVSAQKMFNKVIQESCSAEYMEIMLEFADLSTISERMQDKNSITCEFVGLNYGWTRMSLVSLEKEDGVQKRVLLTTQIIDTEKRKQIDLLFKTNNDELTGLYNRRAFHNEIASIGKSSCCDNLVIASIDVNGLKIANDTLGHAAGDELIIGTADCMKRCFSTYGKIYRTGGDEFYAIIYADSKRLASIKQDFSDMVTAWKGKFSSSLAVSCGYIEQSEDRSAKIHDLVILADDRMYEDKARFYKQKGVDRRGLKDAHIALCSLYSKILKINITSDQYSIVDMDESDPVNSRGMSDKISEWISTFGKSGNVHPDYLPEYLEKTSINYMREYFRQGKSSLNIIYKRKWDNCYKLSMMQIIPAPDYKHDSQSLFLYVKSLES